MESGGKGEGPGWGATRGAGNGEPPGRRSLPALTPLAPLSSQFMHEGVGCLEKQHDMSRVSGR